MKPATTGSGFTLLELLVAISVLAIVSVIAWRGLDTLVVTRERLEPAGDETRALLTAFGQLERDLAQVVNPTLFATGINPIQVVRVGNEPALAIMRIAPEAPDGVTAMQTIGYRVADGVLLRSAGPPQRSHAAVSAERLSHARLLADVRSIKLRVWREGQGWIDPLNSEGIAPPPAAAAGAPIIVPPGVELTVERTDGKIFRRVLLVG